MACRDIIALGGSMGAVDALRRLVGTLPPAPFAAMFIVIHVGAMGKNLLAGIFQEHAAFPISTAVDGEKLQPGQAYVAPADHHLLVLGDTIRLGRGPRENLSRPAIDPLFRSVGLSFGPRAVGVVLTGMLNDGAAGLADLKRCGGITIVQNPSDALAPEMPLGALEGSDIDYRCSLDDMPALIDKLLGEEVGPAADVPTDIRREVEIALGRRPNVSIAPLGQPIPLSCPACGGVLSQMNRRPLKFRCQVGHAYSAETLATQKEGSIDEAMRVALRILEESALLAEKIAEEARRSGRNSAANVAEGRAKEYRARAKILRRAISDI